MSGAEVERALELRNKAIVVDACAVETIEDPKYLDEFRSSVDVGVLSLVDGGDSGWGEDAQQTLEHLDKFANLVERYQDRMVLATTVNRIEDAKRGGKLSVVFGFQDSRPIGTDFRFLRLFYKLGVRLIQLTYNSTNFVGSGHGEKDGGGLTLFGQRAVEEINKMGIVIDIAHCGDKTTMDGVDYSKAPVVATHSNARSLCNNPRNKTDEQIKALAEKGGVIGVCAIPPLVTEEGRPTLDNLLDHIDYIGKLVGVDHIGFGADLNRYYMDRGLIHPRSVRSTWGKIRSDWAHTFDRLYDANMTTVGLERYSMYVPNLSKGLVARGYSDQEILGILGGNFLRVFKQVWRE